MIRIKTSLILCALAIALVPTPFATAQKRSEPSFTDTVDAVQKRLTTTLGADKLSSIPVNDLAAALTPEERQLLGTTFIRFTISQPARVHIIIPPLKNDDPFWLAENGFKRDKDSAWEAGARTYQSWSRVFPAGKVGLGAPSLSGERYAYAIVVAPAKPGDPGPEVSKLSSSRLRLSKVAIGESIYADSATALLTKAPPAMLGQTIIRTLNATRDQGRIQGTTRQTRFPATDKPRPVTLTWTGEPTTTQTIRWRTSDAVTTGTLALARGETATFDLATAKKFTAATETLATPDITNAPRVNFHTVNLEGLEPGTRYTYSAGSGAADGWTAPATFTTAPAPGDQRPYSFIYLGDPQHGFDTWGRMMTGALQQRPDTAFIIMTGDIVTRGRDRDDWDDFAHHTQGVFDARPAVPAVGNHDYQGGSPRLYLRHFALRANGPKNIGPGLAYSFEYSDALVVMLDSNRDIEGQVPWLEQQLRDTRALWKFVAYHHPAYNSRPGRTSTEIIRHWQPLFDKYHVDIAFQGHDHAYLRTYPIRANKRVASPKEGTIYLIANSGAKHYAQAKHDYIEAGFTDASSWQIIDISPAQRTLRFRAYDDAGKLRDEFAITK